SLQVSAPPRPLHSFPTRRSSDLSTARRAARTEPGPPMSAYRLDMSLITPILITPSETWACAPVAASATATAATDLRIANITPPRSEERRVGKECRSEWCAQH